MSCVPFFPSELQILAEINLKLHGTCILRQDNEPVDDVVDVCRRSRPRGQRVLLLLDALQSAAPGGNLDGPGPVIADGALYVVSGYQGSLDIMTGAAPPLNVLLAFSIDGR